MSKFSTYKAITLGFEKVNDPNAYNGYFLIRNGLKWVFDLNALKGHLRINDNEQLISMGYDVNTYLELLKN